MKKIFNQCFLEFVQIDRLNRCRRISGITLSESLTHKGTTMKEQDLLRRLEKFPGENPDIGVDCELRLGFSSSQPNPPPENCRRFICDALPPPPQVMTSYAKGPPPTAAVNVNGYWATNGPNQIDWIPSLVGPRNYLLSSSSSGPNVINASVGMGLLPMQRLNNVALMGYGFHMIAEANRRGDPIKRCAGCETTNTPLWRNGPKGFKSLCNACGLRYKKEEKKILGSPDTHSKSRGRKLSRKHNF
ncbi:PREDICTED: GATA zinc finger domain-containing protein 12-like [Nelumbo nucifera]|uniref:GATA zinc finger domain-containing protein 12-like n=2 Tax=Nelumbo nucifera TaxID=4432 RepID=A0A1U7ZUZ3_NELNU|nr:PREDICTED: GATA zinc finger domain-containing protein 12-like [Nelumbo nucifera]